MLPGFAEGAMVGAGCRRRAAGAAVRRCRRPPHRRSLRRAGRQDGATGRSRRPCHRGRPCPDRMARLRDNLARLALQAETVVAEPPNGPDNERGGFDGVLLDAPCASTGTIRRHPDVAWSRRGRYRRAGGAAAAAAAAGCRLLKPGGTLVYCTCSLEPEEGERPIEGFSRGDAGPAPAFRSTASEVAGLGETVGPDGDLRTLPCICRRRSPARRARRLLRRPADTVLILHRISGSRACDLAAGKSDVLGAYPDDKRFGAESSHRGQPRATLSVAQRRYISSWSWPVSRATAMSRPAAARWRCRWLWPGRTDRLMIAPQDLRAADATRAAEIMPGASSSPARS